MKNTVSQNIIGGQAMSKFTDFFDAWVFLNEHNYFEHGKYGEPMFTESLNIWALKVDPETNLVDEEDESKNTKTQVYLWCGDWADLPDDDWHGYVHDMDLDVQADTFEEAVVLLANKVYEAHGENPPSYGELSGEEKQEVDEKWGKMLGSFEPATPFTASVTFERKDSVE